MAVQAAGRGRERKERSREGWGSGYSPPTSWPRTSKRNVLNRTCTFARASHMLHQAIHLWDSNCSLYSWPRTQEGKNCSQAAHVVGWFGHSNFLRRERWLAERCLWHWCLGMCYRWQDPVGVSAYPQASSRVESIGTYSICVFFACFPVLQTLLPYIYTHTRHTHIYIHISFVISSFW